MASKLRCPYCGRDDFNSGKALQQHQQRNQVCRNAIFRSMKTPSKTSAIAHDYMQMTAISKQKANNQAPMSKGCSSSITKNNVDNTQKQPVTRTNKRTIEDVNESEEDYIDVFYDEEASFGSHFDEAGAVGVAAN